PSATRRCTVAASHGPDAGVAWASTSAPACRATTRPPASVAWANTGCPRSRATLPIALATAASIRRTPSLPPTMEPVNSFTPRALRQLLARAVATGLGINHFRHVAFDAEVVAADIDRRASRREERHAGAQHPRTSDLAGLDPAHQRLGLARCRGQAKDRGEHPMPAHPRQGLTKL